VTLANQAPCYGEISLWGFDHLIWNVRCQCRTVSFQAPAHCRLQCDVTVTPCTSCWTGHCDDANVDAWKAQCHASCERIAASPPRGGSQGNPGGARGGDTITESRIGPARSTEERLAIRSPGPETVTWDRQVDSLKTEQGSAQLHCHRRVRNRGEGRVRVCTR
jgi:hypothetical protein